MKSNNQNLTNNSWHWLYFWGISIILCLPILSWQPLFFPPDWGKTIVFRIIMAILLFCFGCQFLYKREELQLPNIKKNKIALALIALFLIYFISSIFSVDILYSFWGNPLRAGGFVNFGFYIIFAILVFLVSKNEDYKKYITTAIATGVVISAIAIIQYYSLFSNIIVATPQRPSSTIGNPIFFAIYLLLMIFLSLALAIKEKNKYLKYFYFFACAIFLVSILISSSRASWLGMLIGSIFFLLFYPKKIKYLKIVVLTFLILISFIVFYSNIINKYPKFIEDNKIFQSVNPRLSVKEFLGDARFPAWEAGIKAVLDKPILGWGIENFYVGFDKYFFSDIGAEWWDRAHNILIQTAGDAGIPALIIYISLFVIAILELQKVKKNNESLLPHAIQTTLIAYFVANIFSIDCYPTYILSFFLFALAMGFLKNNDEKISQNFNKKNWHKTTFAIVGGIILIIFLWQYNFLPLILAKRINEVQSYIDQKKCNDAFAELDDQISKHSFLDAYIRLRYVNALSTCAGIYPNKNAEYAKRGVELMKEAIKIQPLYSRLWILLGGFTISLANNQQDPAIKESLVKEAIEYFDKAEELTPGHQITLIERIKLNIVLKNYQEALNQSNKCIAIGENYGNCYWVKGVIEIFLGQDKEAEKNFSLALSKGFWPESVDYYQLVEAYSDTENYQKLEEVYKKLIYIDPKIPEYHSSLAFVYYNLKEYSKAKEEALKFGQLKPEAQDEVIEFLKLLPQ